MFPSPKTGEMYHPDSVVNIHKKILKDAGLEHLRFHDLRHTFATLALQNGVDVKTVSSMLGHFDAGFTLEGLMNPDGTVSDIQKAFMDETAIQCGFCTPGFILTATEILASGKEYTDDELRKLLSGHLCRCTGYQNIFRAVKKTMLRRLGKYEEAEAVR